MDIAKLVMQVIITPIIGAVPILIPIVLAAPLQLHATRAVLLGRLVLEGLALLVRLIYQTAQNAHQQRHALNALTIPMPLRQLHVNFAHH